MARALPARARRLLPVLLVVFLAFSYLRLREPAPPASEASQSGAARSRLRSFSGEAMGTTYSAKLDLPEAVSQAQARAAITSALSAVDAAMSTYRKDSELSRWNAARADQVLPISAELRAVLEIALQVGRASGGALDVTLGPVVDAWGFGPGREGPPHLAREEPPHPAHAAPEVNDALLSQLRGRIGLDKLVLSEDGLLKRVPGLRLDLSAVAKGYAVDQAAEALRAIGVARFLVEVGGELIAVGSKPGGQPWRVAIERPVDVDNARQAQRTVALVDLGMATSGDYRNFYERGGKRMSHLIDPRTGRPIAHGLASVSVFHERVAVADAWATALAVLGPEAGVQTAEQQGIAAFFIMRAPQGELKTVSTARFRARFPQD